jgi:hypothetical protein
VFRRIRRLPSPALVIAAIALVLSIGGGTFAIAALTQHDKKVVKKIAKKVANKQITKRAPSLSVNHANSANTANSADNASQLGGVGANGYQQTKDLLFATVDVSGTTATLVSNRSRGAVGASRISTGLYNLQVNRDVSGCTWLATAGSNTVFGADRFAETRAPQMGSSPDNMTVVVWNTAGAQADPSAFFVEVLCP